MNDKLTVGYLQTWGNKVSFVEALNAGYDTMALAFGTLDEAVVGITDGIPPNLKEDIAEAKSNGAKHILLSFGGAKDYNTYKPGDASAEDAGQAIVNFANDYGFTGIDFDLEIDGTQSDNIYLDDLCFEIKKFNEKLLITAAPQISQGPHDTDLTLVSDGNTSIYEVALENKRFDYLFIQAYNNPWPKLSNCSQVDTCFISAAYNNFSKQNLASMIVIGEPATASAAGTSIFKTQGEGQEVYDAVAQEYASIQDEEQFGGAMTWSINLDAENDYKFIKTLKSKVYF
ncbi:glycosyl hydrolase family 18 protein [Aureibacter tunicatorum]|uniref:Chitinase n=1 Tax=Aureibacter tunicatorum TaxID=866807 RepID=A0AAE3XMA1_9BACT|nr:glycosyl hydrolase family 18 protein [Aureibacter tunicatorum]MDR6237559.1 chitinase [Aureibacter tunicatorum]BDD02593.1 hypothetical protein AUTU_00760 [Aureibacter tunicatorum]